MRDKAAEVLAEFAQHLQTSRFVPARDRRAAGKAIDCLIGLVKERDDLIDERDTYLEALELDNLVLRGLLVGTVPPTPVEIRLPDVPPLTRCVDELLTSWEHH